MLFSRLHRRFTTWLALLAMVMAALAPTLAQAVVASSDRAGWVEVCSVSGMVWVQADADAAPSEGALPPMADGSMQCPWCSLHGGAPGLPPAHDLAQPLPRQTDLPPAFYSAVTRSGPWAPPQARAPPFSA